MRQAVSLVLARANATTGARVDVDGYSVYRGGAHVLAANCAPRATHALSYADSLFCASS